MVKLLSKNLLSPILIGLAVWVSALLPASANPAGVGVASPSENRSTDVNAKNTTQQGATPAPVKVTNNLAATTAEPNAAQINQATEATEIQRSDWAYQTLAALSDKYNCGNMPAGTEAISREQFATSLNGCVQSIEQLVARRKPSRGIKKRKPAAPAVVTPPPTPEVVPAPPEPAPVVPPAPVEPEVSQQDLDRLKQLVQSFSTELQAVDGRIQAVDAKVTKLKDQSFSTTTKLVGEAIFAVTGLAGGPNSATRTTIFSDRVRLNFRSSFTGKDLLLVRLQSRNSNSFAGAASGTNMTRLGFEGSEENATNLQRLQYQLPLAPTTKVFIETVGSEFNDNYYTFNPEHQSAGLGAVTRFGRFNPVYRLSGEGAGIGVDHKFSPNLGFVLSYAVPRVATPGAVAVPGVINPPETVNNPTGSNGLFNGSNVIFSQLTLKPSEDVSLGLIYARAYNSTGTGVSGNTGSSIANSPFGAAPTSANHYSVLGSVNLSKDLVLSAWGGLTQATREATGGGSADIWNYAATLAVKDFGSKGSTLGFVVGMQPKLTGNSFFNNAGTANAARRVDRDTSMHIEAFYKYKFSDNLYVTPGLLLLTNPESNASNPTEYLGTIRTTFVF
ncbi:iron uptake porin [Chamaesiphon sp. GL140_3_metabinner_50]|uniref:iron uptake porin n=1 Tax=Chamaesiphon sp. GL140_3_metabinner_50 TaxID=2970812 RepID=UPI0026008D40|nr:iron uptake porin [Chamaesiphon sp. GL140_3_metabinner_50]